MTAYVSAPKSPVNQFPLSRPLEQWVIMWNQPAYTDDMLSNKNTRREWWDIHLLFSKLWRFENCTVRKGKRERDMRDMKKRVNWKWQFELRTHCKPFSEPRPEHNSTRRLSRKARSDRSLSCVSFRNTKKYTLKARAANKIIPLTTTHDQSARSRAVFFFRRVSRLLYYKLELY